MNAHAIASLGRRIPPGQLRLGVVTERQIERWKFAVIEALCAEPAVCLQSLFVDTANHQRKPSPLWTAYQRRSSKAADPFGLLDASSLKNKFGSEAAMLWGKEKNLSEESRSLISSKGLDVLIWLAEVRSEGDCGGLARFGVWRFSEGDPERPANQPSYFREARDREPVSELAIVVHQSNFRIGSVIYEYLASTIRSGYFTRNAIEALNPAGVFLLRRLLDLLEYGPEYLKQTCQPRTSFCHQPSSFTDWHLLQFLSRQLAHSISQRCRARGRKMRWFTAVRFDGENFAPSTERFEATGFRPVVPNRGYEEADPFVIEHQGKHFLFFEEIPPSGRGRIAVREIRRDLTATAPVTVLEPSYHVSYPFLLREGDQILMLPETSENQTVELYLATEFPYRWRLERVLVEGVALVDTTPFLYEGVWFFFTTADHSGELLLFYSERLDCKWHYHPRNPICSDVRRARMAGALFYRGGRLIRPAQDGSTRYGYAMTLNEVTALSTFEYSERPIERIQPDWEKGLLGTHTLNSNGSVEVIDGRHYRR